MWQVWQVKGWMAGSKGEARFAPARCLRAAARPVGGGDAQTAGGLSTRGSSSVAGCRQRRAVAHERLHGEGVVRWTTERAHAGDAADNRQQTEGPAATRL